MEIILSTVFAILGAVLGVIAARWDSWQQISSRGDLRGSWISLSHGGDHEVVRDKISISKKRGKLYFRNSGNDYGYLFECYCTIESRNIISGTWRSMRPGATSKGRVLLLANPQGTSMHGVYSGKTDDGKDVILWWVLAKSEEELTRVIDRLKSTVVLPKEQSNFEARHITA